MDHSMALVEGKQCPARTREQAQYLSLVAEGHSAYLMTIFKAIQATVETAPKLAVDLARLGEYVAEQMEGEIDGVSTILQRSQGVH